MGANEYLQPHLFHEVRTDDPEGPYQYVTPSGLDLERAGRYGAGSRGFDIADTPTSGVHKLRTTERYVDPESRNMSHMDITPKPGSPESIWHANRHLNTMGLAGEVGASAEDDNTRGMSPVPFDPADIAMREEPIADQARQITVFHDRRDPERTLGKVDYFTHRDRTDVGNAFMDPAFRGQGLSQAAAGKWLAGRDRVTTHGFSEAGQAAFSRHGVESRGGLSGQGRR